MYLVVCMRVVWVRIRRDLGEFSQRPVCFQNDSENLHDADPPEPPSSSVHLVPPLLELLEACP